MIDELPDEIWAYGDPLNGWFEEEQSYSGGLRYTRADPWQDISSVTDEMKRDGTAFIGYSPTHGVNYNVQWSDERKDFDINGWSFLKRDWTHWQPHNTPAPPQTPEGS